MSGGKPPGGCAGRNAAAVIDFAAAAGRKFPYERIGYLADRAVLLARGVIDSLDAAPRGNVVFGGREFQQGIVSQRTGRLHEALSEALLSDQYGPVEILERAGDDLGRRSRIAVDQHGQRQIGQDRIVRGAEDILLRSGPSLGADHLRTFGNEHRNDLDGFLQNAASVAPVVEDQSPQGILCAEFLDRGAHLFVRSFGEVAVLDISDPFCDEPGVGDAGNGYPFARQSESVVLAADQPFDDDSDGGVGRAFQGGTYLCGVPTLGVLAFDREDLVADADAGPVGRGAFVGLCENYVIAFLADHRTDASVLARGEQVEVRHLLFGQKFGVGVEVAGHAFGGILH